MKTSFISCEDADDIIQTLEMRFGNAKLIAESLLRQLRKLPNLRDDNSKLVELATTLKNAAAAIKSLGKNESYLRVQN